MVTAVCVVALAAAAFAVVRWGGLAAGGAEPSPIATSGGGRQHTAGGNPVRRMLRTLSLAVAGGATAGILVAGLGGRLMMRILAATSDDAVQGRLTEAEERIGEITAGGTIGLVVFVGVFGGTAGGLAYVLVRRWLPGSARTAGLLLGFLLLGLARLDPLNPDNVDFRLLDPAWLAVILVAVLFPLFGMTAASLVERLDRSWPLLERRPAALFAHLPLAVLILTGPFGIVVALSVLVVAAVQRSSDDARPMLRSRRAIVTGRVVLGIAGAAGLIWVCAGIADILENA